MVKRNEQNVRYEFTRNVVITSVPNSRSILAHVLDWLKNDFTAMLDVVWLLVRSVELSKKCSIQIADILKEDSAYMTLSWSKPRHYGYEYTLGNPTTPVE